MFQLFSKERSIRNNNTELKRLKRKRYKQTRRARINDFLKRINNQLSVYKMSKVEILKEGKHSYFMIDQPSYDLLIYYSFTLSACVKIESLTNENEHLNKNLSN
ncbi:hypothetical protein F8M41_010157 [Gigaspora margarita]|uniref:Uncharacterized protein n=1 Tax=Gigaspora margarita TaxID=4874 RepID=A0A8H4A3H9_GIGMA|nr:hypothetical protein F8M41_010157 [Gigaspora margarita]